MGKGLAADAASAGTALKVVNIVSKIRRVDRIRFAPVEISTA
jgi:hypothetical protein